MHGRISGSGRLVLIQMPKNKCEECGKPARLKRCDACQLAFMRAANEAFRQQCEANPHSWRRSGLRKFRPKNEQQ